MGTGRALWKGPLEAVLYDCFGLGTPVIYTERSIIHSGRAVCGRHAASKIGKRREAAQAGRQDVTEAVFQLAQAAHEGERLRMVGRPAQVTGTSELCVKMPRQRQWDAQGKPEIPVRREASAVAGHLGGVGGAACVQRLPSERSGAGAQGVDAQRRVGVFRGPCGDALQPGHRSGRGGIRRRRQLHSYRATGEVRKVDLRAEIAGQRDHRLPVCEARPGISAVRCCGRRNHRCVHALRHRCGGCGGVGCSGVVVATSALPPALEQSAKRQLVMHRKGIALGLLGSYRDRGARCPALLRLGEHTLGRVPCFVAHQAGDAAVVFRGGPVGWHVSVKAANSG